MKLLLIVSTLIFIILLGCDPVQDTPEEVSADSLQVVDSSSIVIQPELEPELNLDNTDSLVVPVATVLYEDRYLTAENTAGFLLHEMYADSVILVIGGDRKEVLDAPFGEIVTEAEYLEPVIIVERDSLYSDWCRIELPVQRGYTGYLLRDDIIQLTGGPYEGIAIVSSPTTTAMGAPASGVSLRELRGASVLPVCLVTDSYIQTELEEGYGWVPLEDLCMLKDSATCSSEEIIATARDMIGVEYVWGGTTWGSIDCSGFINLVFRMNGYLVKRDCGIQYADSSGVLVDYDGRSTGDLIYISTYLSGPSHVGILSGNGKVIHCGSGGVSEISIAGSTFARNDVIGYKRF